MARMPCQNLAGRQNRAGVSTTWYEKRGSRPPNVMALNTTMTVVNSWLAPRSIALFGRVRHSRIVGQCHRSAQTSDARAMRERP
jgi:hypothetical protein